MNTAEYEDYSKLMEENTRLKCRIDELNVSCHVLRSNLERYQKLKLDTQLEELLGTTNILEAINRVRKLNQAEVEVERLKIERDNALLDVEGLDRLYKSEAELAKLRARLEDINNKCVSFHECGPYSDNEEIKRVMEIYELSDLGETEKGGLA